ncbi:MAG: hypothetical protein MMC33_002153 [Icmadophila ericetorum]|nr:hypothetical protein [Icmadophila ericetorum]
MDFLEEYFSAAMHMYTNYYAPYQQYVRPLRRYLFLIQSYAYRYIFPYLWPVYKLSTRLIGSAMSDKPDLMSIVILAVIALISLKVMDMTRRYIVYWINMALKLALWACVGILGVYVYQRGVEQSVEDAGWLLAWLGQTEKEGKKIGQTKSRRKAYDARRAY